MPKENTRQRVNVICMKWGEKYDALYVNRLHNMVKRNLTISHRFVCFTDNANGLDEGIETFPMPEIYVPKKNQYSPWKKLALLGEKLGNLEGLSLFLDLDIVILENIDCFFSHPGEFCIIENWTQAGQKIGNSSVYRFNVGAHKDVFNYYLEHTDEVVKKHKNEQIYLSKKIGAEKPLTFWPEEWCRSFKQNCIPSWPIRFFRTPTPPKGTKIVVFHGFPHPDHAINGEWPTNGKCWKKLYKYIKPAKWVDEYWR